MFLSRDEHIYIILPDKDLPLLKTDNIYYSPESRIKFTY